MHAIIIAWLLANPTTLWETDPEPPHLSLAASFRHFNRPFSCAFRALKGRASCFPSPHTSFCCVSAAHWGLRGHKHVWPHSGTPKADCCVCWTATQSTGLFFVAGGWRKYPAWWDWKYAKWLPVIFSSCSHDRITLTDKWSLCKVAV